MGRISIHMGGRGVEEVVGAAPVFQAVKKRSPEGAGLVFSPINVTRGGGGEDKMRAQ